MWRKTGTFVDIEGWAWYKGYIKNPPKVVGRENNGAMLKGEEAYE